MTASVKFKVLNPDSSLPRLRDRVTVKTGPRHTVREADDGTFEMTIKAAVRSDSGIYTCKIINEYGIKQCEGMLEVKGVLPLVCPHFTTSCDDAV